MVAVVNRTSKPFTVTLGAATATAEAMVSSGRYASMSEVMRAGVRALDREERALDSWVNQRLNEEAHAPSRMMPADDVFDRQLGQMRQQRGRDAA